MSKKKIKEIKEKAYSVTDHPRYEEARKLSSDLRKELNKSRKEAKLEISDVVAMSQGNDPYWMTTGKVLKAYWAEEVMETIVKPWLRAQGVKNMHLRNIHYNMTRSAEILTWNGEQYQNTDAHWKDLIEAFANARYLGLVDWKLIRDNKNELAHRTSYKVPRTFDEAIDKVRENLTAEVAIDKLVKKPFNDMLNVWHFQPVHVELWAEKDLSLLEKVAKGWSINTITGEGEISITQIYLAAERIVQAKKPVRIGYISDCDVVGTNMVKAMARKLEYRLKAQLRKRNVDVKVVPLMATPEQIEELGLPTTPHKRAKAQAYQTRVDNWLETRNMTGAVEVNSLESLHPEYFKQVLEDFIRSYVDVEKWNEVINFRKEIPDWVIGHLDDSEIDMSSFDDMIDAVDWTDIEADHNGRITDMGESEMDYEENDPNYKWLLDTKLKYGEQLGLYRKYDRGDL